jgi:hypothetical protein
VQEPDCENTAQNSAKFLETDLKNRLGSDFVLASVHVVVVRVYTFFIIGADIHGGEASEGTVKKKSWLTSGWVYLFINKL